MFLVGHSCLYKVSPAQVTCKAADSGLAHQGGQGSTNLRGTNSFKIHVVPMRYSRKNPCPRVLIALELRTWRITITITWEHLSETLDLARSICLHDSYVNLSWYVRDWGHRRATQITWIKFNHWYAVFPLWGGLIATGRCVLHPNLSVVKIFACSSHRNSSEGACKGAVTTRVLVSCGHVEGEAPVVIATLHHCWVFQPNLQQGLQVVIWF